MSKEQKIHAIISAITWIAFVVELVIIDGFNGWAIFLLTFGIMISVVTIKTCPNEYYLIFVPLLFVITIAVGIPMRNCNMDTQAKAVELYEQGRYEESMDEFMKIKNTGFIDEYVEEYTVYKLKGTDIERMEDE